MLHKMLNMTNLNYFYYLFRKPEMALFDFIQNHNSTWPCWNKTILKSKHLSLHMKCMLMHSELTSENKLTFFLMRLHCDFVQIFITQLFWTTTIKGKSSSDVVRWSVHSDGFSFMSAFICHEGLNWNQSQNKNDLKFKKWINNKNLMHLYLIPLLWNN